MNCKEGASLCHQYKTSSNANNAATRKPITFTTAESARTEPRAGAAATTKAGPRSATRRASPAAGIHEINEGFGALFYGSLGGGGFASSCLRSAQELAKAERWLREALAKGEVKPKNSYLTRWNKETKWVELVVGEFYEWPETAAQGATDEQTEEMPDSREETNERSPI